jgi:hypothetical protein
MRSSLSSALHQTSSRSMKAISGENIHSQIMQQHPDVVTEMEGKYIFFADEAEIARKMVGSGHSCVVSVYFREP